MNTEDKAEKTELDRDFETLSFVRSGIETAAAEVSKNLFQEYKRSSEFVAHTAADSALTPSDIMTLAREKTLSDWLVAQIVLSQEGQIAPKNAFHMKEDLVRKGMTIEGDRSRLWSVNHGYSQLCIHGANNEMVFGQLESAVGQLSKALGLAVGLDVDK